MSSLIISLGILLTGVVSIIVLASQAGAPPKQNSDRKEENLKDSRSNDFLDFSGGFLGI